MTSRLLLLTAAVLALAPVACTSPTSTSRKPIDLSFSQMAPLILNVGGVQVLNTASATNNPRVNPGEALERYARKRLQAAGGEGTLNFVIQQASLTSREAPRNSDWTGAFQLSNPIEYTVTMKVGLDLVNRVTLPNVKSAYTLERKKTLPESASLAERDRELNDLVVGMVADMDKAIERGLSENMRLIVRPGPITFGRPEPLDSQGAVPMQPNAPASPAAVPQPVIIQGTMD